MYQLHANWLQSKQLSAHLAAHHHEDCLEHGLVYSAEVSRCIAGADDNKVCVDVLKKWSSQADPSYPDNLLARAVLLNIEH